MNSLRNKEFCIAFGANLKKLRLGKGYTLRAFALEAGIEHSQLSKIERGDINPTISTVLALSEALEISIQDIFEFKFVNKSKK